MTPTDQEIEKAIRRVEDYAREFSKAFHDDVTLIKTALAAARKDTERLNKQIKQLDETLTNMADTAADNMEGENMPSFSIYESYMSVAIHMMKILGVKYDPISGQRTAIDQLKEGEE